MVRLEQIFYKYKAKVRPEISPQLVIESTGLRAPIVFSQKEELGYLPGYYFLIDDKSSEVPILFYKEPVREDIIP